MQYFIGYSGSIGCLRQLLYILGDPGNQFTNRASGIDSGSAPAPQTGSQPTTQPVSGGPQEIHQWAVSATASTQYSESSWNAEQATGAPNVMECGDNGLAWASSNDNGVEWLELAYAIPVIPTEIVIHQSYNPL